MKEAVGAVISDDWPRPAPVLCRRRFDFHLYNERRDLVFLHAKEHPQNDLVGVAGGNVDQHVPLVWLRVVETDLQPRRRSTCFVGVPDGDGHLFRTKPSDGRGIFVRRHKAVAQPKDLSCGTLPKGEDELPAGRPRAEPRLRSCVAGLRPTYLAEAPPFFSASRICFRAFSARSQSLRPLRLSRRRRPFASLALSISRDSWKPFVGLLAEPLF